MGYELITTWGDYQAAIDRVLSLATQRLWIYDPDLAQLKLEQPARLGSLRRLLQNGETDCLRIVLRDARAFRDRSPLLNALLRQHSHCMAVNESAENLAHLRDSMVLADDRHGLIRFDQDQARSKVLTDDVHELAPYFNRFESLWHAGGTAVSATALGL